MCRLYHSTAVGEGPIEVDGDFEQRTGTIKFAGVALLQSVNIKRTR
jgi:hypothetical protein